MGKGHWPYFGFIKKIIIKSLKGMSLNSNLHQILRGAVAT